MINTCMCVCTCYIHIQHTFSKSTYVKENVLVQNEKQERFRLMRFGFWGSPLGKVGGATTVTEVLVHHGKTRVDLWCPKSQENSTCECLFSNKCCWFQCAFWVPNCYLFFIIDRAVVCLVQLLDETLFWTPMINKVIFS